MIDSLLEPFDLALASRLSRIAGESDEGRRLLVAHAIAAVRDGHVCLDAELHARRLGIDDQVARRSLGAIAASPLVVRVAADSGTIPGGAPLVLDPQGRLYLARYFDHQQTLAARLVALAHARIPAATPRGELVDALFPPVSPSSDDRQRAAALGALARAFTIVSGGPGTGKTSTVVKLLALLADAALASGAVAPRTVLLAPTGKAAARLGESIRGALARLPVSEAVRAAIPVVASTIHRALGVRREGGYRHGPERPIVADVVLVDEASMVDLALMRALVDAVRPGTRLVLLGDRDQLASVEAGSVLTDLCDAAQRPGSPLAGSFQELVTSHRFTEASGIGALARAIRAGDAATVRAVLADPSTGDVVREDALPVRGRLPTTIQRAARAGYAGLLAESPQDQLAALGTFRVLTAHRRGSLGVTELGARIASSIGRSAEAGAFGAPILVLENDVDVDLSNGDVGVVGHESAEHLTTWFPTVNGPRAVSIARLPRHETCWAMSIHKSQGSEFDSVAVVLPDGSELASRELLYTAITRAKSSVVVYASEAALDACLARTVVRASGLVDAILARNPR